MTTYKDKTLNKGLRRRDFLTRFPDLKLSLRSTFNPTNFDLRMPTLSKEGKKTREKIKFKKIREAFRKKLIMH